jgi:hypothetical protein
MAGLCQVLGKQLAVDFDDRAPIILLHRYFGK